MSDVLRPPGIGGPDFPVGPPGGGPEVPPPIPPEMREYYERAGGVPIGGEKIIRRLRTVEIGEEGNTDALERVLETALSYREGLVFGPSGTPYEFDPEKTGDRVNKAKVAWLQNLFTTGEHSTKRSSSIPYVDISIDQAIDERIQRASEWRNDRDSWREETESELLIQGRSREEIGEIIKKQEERLAREYLAIPRLLELSLYVQSRETFDTAFIHRMLTCEDPGSAARLGIEMRSPTPDGTHWLGLFTGSEKGEFGQEVNDVLEEIVKFGLPDEVVEKLGMEPIPASIRKQVKNDVYATSFENGVAFGTWINHLLKKGNGRMDVVWNAWKVALTTEIVDKLGEAVDKKGNWSLAAPPIGNALMTFLAHLDKKRSIEYGLDAQGKRVQIERYISHSGLPMSMGQIEELCSDFFHESTVKFDQAALKKLEPVMATLLDNIQKLLPLHIKNFEREQERLDQLQKDILSCWNEEKPSVEISLWDIWLYGRLSMANSDFPWFMTDQPDAEAEAGELPPGSFGGWLLKRYRAGKPGDPGSSVLVDIRSRPTIQELSDPDFFVKRLRNWAKVLGKVKEDKPPEENPRAWWLAGILQFHSGKTGKTSPIVRNDPTRDYRTLISGQELERRPEALSAKGTGIGDIFWNARQCGFIREKDQKWIEEQLGIKLM